MALLSSIYNATLVQFDFYIIYTGMRKGYINRGSMVHVMSKTTTQRVFSCNIGVVYHEDEQMINHLINTFVRNLYA